MRWPVRFQPAAVESADRVVISGVRLAMKAAGATCARRVTTHGPAARMLVSAQINGAGEPRGTSTSASDQSACPEHRSVDLRDHSGNAVRASSQRRVGTDRMRPDWRSATTSRRRPPEEPTMNQDLQTLPRICVACDGATCTCRRCQSASIACVCRANRTRALSCTSAACGS
jgi:hypothetical protein